MIKPEVRVRFAPSPTGHLHIGGLRTALFNWLFARHHKGKFLVRIEDTDHERSKQEFTDSILDSLAWTGIESDEALVIQSQRINAYQKILNQLLDEGKTYRCYCSPEEVIERQNPSLLYNKYDGKCRELAGTAVSIEQKDKPFVIRFAIPAHITEITFADLIREKVTFAKDQLDDFIIARTDGHPMYNFVVVVDDAHMQMTHVIRGEDHISNTPKQILLYQACGYKIPQFAHLPLILGPSGNRLSKRDAATSVLEYKESGYLAPALINYLSRLGWSHGDQELFTKEELINFFTLDHVGKKGSIFDAEKLKWVNQSYLHAMKASKLLKIMIQDVVPTLVKELISIDKDMLHALIDLYKKRVSTLRELANELVIVTCAPSEFVQEDIQKWTTADTVNHLQKLKQSIEGLSEYTVDSLKATVKNITKELGLKMVHIAQPIRLALIGKASGPGVFELAEILGSHEVTERIAALIKKLQ